MKDLPFSDYLTTILDDASLGELLFFQDKKTSYTYRNLIQSAFNKAQDLMLLDDEFFALQIESSYSLFVHLLAGIFAHKKMLVLSSKEPELSVARFRDSFHFTKILTELNSPLSFNEVENFQIPVVDNSATAFIILSSGSTGPSKLVPLTLKNVFSSAQDLIDFFPMNSSDTSFLNLPHHHIGGLMILWRAFFSHGSVSNNSELPYHFISLVPLQLKRLLDNSEEISKLQKCKGILIGGAVLELELRQNATGKGLPIFETYGMSESCSLVMLNGRPLKHQTVKLDSEGHILIKGPTLSPQLILDSEGFYHTKDMGIKNLDGSFSFQHRSDLLFKSAGEMINPLEIEARVRNLPWIKTAVIVPIVHPEWTSASTLLYELNDSTKSAKDISDYLKEHLHPHLVPRFFYEIPKNLMTEGMKPNRFELKRWAQQKYFSDRFHTLFISNNNSKKLLVFFHGFMEDHTDLIPLMDDHKDFSYLFIDLPGHGKTKIENFKSRDLIFNELISLINFYKKDGELYLYGYSQGGRVALELATTLKPKILILESAHFGMNSEEEKRLRLNQDRQLFSSPQLNLREFFHKWYNNPIFGKYDQTHHYNDDIDKKLSHSPIEWQKSLEYFSPGKAPHTLISMCEILKDQKIIGIVGSDDVKYAQHFKEVKKSLNNFEYYTIDGSGHNPHKSHLVQVKNIIAKIL